MSTVIKPNFFIVGAPKCGTTALYEYLRAHPQVFMPDIKEPKYFGSDLRRIRLRRRGLEEYLSLFKEADGYPLIGEATPLYLVSRLAAFEIYEFAPEAKIIIMIRDPIELMYSLHAQCIANGDEDVEDFEAALALEDERDEGKSYSAFTADVERLLYRRCARLSAQIQRFIDRFGRARVHFIVYDDLKADPGGVYKAVLRFLDADDHELPEYRVVNDSRRVRIRAITRIIRWGRTSQAVRRMSRSLMPRRLRAATMQMLIDLDRSKNRVRHERPPLQAGLERQLRSEFKDEVDRLGVLVDRDLSHWSAEPGATNGEQRMRKGCDGHARVG